MIVRRGSGRNAPQSPAVRHTDERATARRQSNQPAAGQTRNECPTRPIRRCWCYRPPPTAHRPPPPPTPPTVRRRRLDPLRPATDTDRHFSSNSEGSHRTRQSSRQDTLANLIGSDGFRIPDKKGFRKWKMVSRTVLMLCLRYATTVYPKQGCAGLMSHESNLTRLTTLIQMSRVRVESARKSGI